MPGDVPNRLNWKLRIDQDRLEAECFTKKCRKRLGNRASILVGTKRARVPGHIGKLFLTDRRGMKAVDGRDMDFFKLTKTSPVGRNFEGFELIRYFFSNQERVDSLDEEAKQFLKIGRANPYLLFGLLSGI